MSNELLNIYYPCTDCEVKYSDKCGNRCTDYNLYVERNRVVYKVMTEVY